MKKGFIDKWKDLEGCQNLLFFAQLVSEQIFDYSIPSNRISTLNSHYLCIDALSAIDDIVDSGVPEGTIKPIIEELYVSLEKDEAFVLSNQSPLSLFVKQENNGYRKIYNTKDIGFKDAQRIVNAIHQKYFSNNSYFHLLKKLIKEIVESNDIDKQDSLFKLTKSFLTELINGGYHQQYIFDQLIYSFFNKKTDVKTPARISRFLDAFTFNEKKFDVVFIADKSFENVTNKYNKYIVKNQLRCRTQLEIEETYLKKDEDYRYFVVEDVEDFDAHSAAYGILKNFQFQASFYRLNDHNVQFDIANQKFFIYDENDYFTIYKHNKSAVKKTKTIPFELIEKNFLKGNQAASSAFRSDFSDGRALLNAVNFHSLSIDTISEENQLLDLWATFETLLNISNKHTSDRIQQIVSILVPVLKQKYLYSLFEQLSADIKNYSKDVHSSILSVVNGQNDVISIAKFVLLDSYECERNQKVSQMTDFPLLKERIMYYNQVLSTKAGVYSFVEKHSRRICWQIMRIYRNRNLIIHNGRAMPYLSLLIENLHSYVDDFIDYMINSFVQDAGKELIYQELFAKECEWLTRMNVKNKAIDEETIEYMLQ